MGGVRLTPLEMLERLVSFDTESQRSNLPLIDFVADYLAGWGVEAVRVPNRDGTKAAIFATIGPRLDGGVVLSGHTDVVPVAGQDWASDPYKLRVENGRAYGRGAVDMKGFDALILAAVPDFLAAGLKRPIHLLLSYDEETTVLGCVDTIARFGKDLPRPAIAIVGEPTRLEVADAHKAVVTFVTEVHGHEAHSAKPDLGANAVMAGAEFVAFLNRVADDMVARGDASGRFDPPYTTVHVGTMTGGTARNILPRLCTIAWEFRALPDLDLEEIPARVRAASDEIARDRLNRHGPFGRIETRLEVSVPGLEPEPDSPAQTLALRIAGKNHTISVPYATEAGHFQRAGIPTVVCGPGWIDRAHQPNEYITLDELAAGEAFLRRLAASLAE